MTGTYTTHIHLRKGMLPAKAVRVGGEFQMGPLIYAWTVYEITKESPYKILFEEMGITRDTIDWAGRIAMKIVMQVIEKPQNPQ